MSAEAFTKIGTGDFTGRVVSGLVPRAEPGSIVLRRLYPHPPADIGVIDRIEAATAQLTVFPSHRRAWSDADRSALTAFFTARYHDHRRLAELLGIAEAIAEAAEWHSSWRGDQMRSRIEADARATARRT